MFSQKAVAKVINESLNTYFADPNIKVISEPGQFFAVPSMTLVVNVHSKTVKKNENGEDIYHYYITDGIYQSFSMKASGKMKLFVLKMFMVKFSYFL